MSENKANLDAWQVLKTVVDSGGFAQAANQLKRSQSAISYSISKLEAQLQLELLTIQGRRAVLTDAGQLLLTRARLVLADYRQLIGYAEHLHRGQAAEISIWIDGIYPMQRLQKPLLVFRQQSPLTRLNIQHGLSQMNLSDFDIVIGANRLPDRSHQVLDELELQAVAKADHPLSVLQEPIEPSSLGQYTRVVLESEAYTRGEQNWPVTTLQQAKEYIGLGLAYGWLPTEMVVKEIKTGQLRPLLMAHGQCYRVMIYLQQLPKNQYNESVQKLASLLNLI